MNKRCYIAGKIGDLPEAEWRANFEQAKAEVVAMGYEPVSPIDLDHNHDKSWLNCMRVDLTALLTCDYLYAQRNWTLSKGARIEVELASVLGLIVLEQPRNSSVDDRKRVGCPFCEGGGCCFCDHEGKIWVGPNEFIKSEEALQSVGVKYLKEADKEAGGGLEVWPELWEHYLDEKNVPDNFKEKP